MGLDDNRWAGMTTD